MINKRKKGVPKIIVLLIVVLQVIIFLLGYAVGYNRGQKRSTPEIINQTEETVIQEEDKSKLTNEEIVEKIMSDMTLDEMIYQMMFVTPESITNVGQVIAAGNATKTALNNYPVGGLVYFADNFQSREQTSEMIKNTQEYSKIPLFIGVDEEGGQVSRLGSNPAMGITKQPPMREIGDTKDASKAYEVGKTLANDLLELGFNVDFAPDSDR